MSEPGINPRAGELPQPADLVDVERPLVHTIITLKLAAVGEIAGLTPTPFEHVNPLGISIFNTDRPAGQLEVVPVAVERRGGGPGHAGGCAAWITR